MTYSIIAHCPHTKRLGLGITTFSLGVGGRCEGIAANVGICKTQAFPNRSNDTLAIKLLAQGFAPSRVMQVLESNDPDHAWRQIGIIDREGNTAAHTGAQTRGWSGHETGAGCVVFGNGLAGPQVLHGMIAGFQAEPDALLEFRLLRALEGGRDAGGQGTAATHRPERSGMIKVVDRQDYPDIYIRVDSHDTAVEELRRILEEFKLYEVFYRERGRNPRAAVPQEVFVARLNASRA